MIVFILVGIFTALLSGATYLYTRSYWVGIATSLLMTGLFSLGRAIRWLAARRKARRIEKVLADPSQTREKKKKADGEDPEVKARIKAMISDFSKALRALRSSKLARGGRDPLEVLPWYLLIGAPGAGKSSALRHSGLKFPYLSSRGGARAGGTRHCDVWLTNEAVLLDTAGRYAQGDDDQEEWFAFLDHVARVRPDRPVNGLIVAVSAGELQSVDHLVAGEMGQRLRERIDEVTSRLKVVLPVYVLLTKCDLIPGFTETFADLPRSERGQIWGFTVPMGARADASTEVLLARFDELSSALEQRALRRLGQERRLETREACYRFPQRFHALRRNLSELVQPLFLGTVFQDTPVMRGVYFCSALQEQRPVEAASQTGPAEPPEGRSYFLWDVFTQVMFPDRGVAVRSSMEELRQQRRRYAVMAAGCAVTLILMGLPAISWWKNRKFILSTSEAITSLQLEHENPYTLVEKLDPLAQRLATLLEYDRGGPPLLMRFGLYRGRQLLAGVDPFYDSALRNVLLGQHHARLEQDLMGFADSNRDRSEWTTETYGAYFDKLKLYLLITRPKAENEPRLASQRKWLVEQMVSHWMRVRGSGGDANMEQLVRAHATIYAERLSREPERLAFPRDENVVRNARRVLTNIPLAELKLQQLIQNAQFEYSDLTVRLRDLVGPIPTVTAGRVVRPAFTYPVWEKMIRPQLNGAFKDQESWVLAPDDSVDPQAVQNELRLKYLRAYVREWSDFLDSIRVRAPGDLSETLDLLAYFNRRPSPLERLFETLHYNVDLERQERVKQSAPETPAGAVAKLLAPAKPDPAPQAAEAPASTAPHSATGEQPFTARDVLASFGGVLRFVRPAATADKEETVVPLKVYQEQLGFVRNDLLELKDRPREAGVILEKLRAARRKVQGLIDSQEVGTHALFERLLLPPLNDVHQLVFRDVVDDKNKLWCGDVVGPFSRMILHRYPLVRDGADTPLSDFAEFFQPETGTVARFERTQLQDDVVPSGKRRKFTTDANLYRAELLTFLEQSGALSAAFFPDGKLLEPKVRFSVRVHGDPAIAVSVLKVDGQEIRYENGPDSEWSRPLEWPGPGRLGAVLHVEGVEPGRKDDLVGPGEWGLFRLLEHAQVAGVEVRDRRFFTVTWNVLGGAKLSVDFRPERSVNPFVDLTRSDARLFEALRDPRLVPPQGISRERPGCGPQPEPDPALARPAAARAPAATVSAGGAP